MRFWQVVVVVAACAHSSTGASGFSIAYPDATTAKVGARFYAKPAGQCHYENGRDARWTITGAQVTSGELPPGVAIIDGALTGTPTHAGAYHARIVFTGVTCAGKELADQTIDVALDVRS
jgi:hypothetical protein